MEPVNEKSPPLADYTAPSNLKTQPGNSTALPTLTGNDGPVGGEWGGEPLPLSPDTPPTPVPLAFREPVPFVLTGTSSDDIARAAMDANAKPAPADATGYEIGLLKGRLERLTDDVEAFRLKIARITFEQRMINLRLDRIFAHFGGKL